MPGLELPAATPPLEVWPYTIETLQRLLAEKSVADPRVVEDKLHTAYFEEYFNKLGAQTVLVENHYIDHDFLEDHAAYYVRCFEEYRRTCTRLHFFNIQFSEQDIHALINREVGPLDDKSLRKAYLGFVVVKPLPETIVGRTCLRTYPTHTAPRSYPITRRYEANPFGLRLRVHTLAFEEQDQVAAACATSALWTVFQGTGVLFHHAILSPVEITRAADRLAPIGTRTLPSEGLNDIQMANAVRSVGLEPLLLEAEDMHVLKSTLYGYLRGRVPVLLGAELIFDKPLFATTEGREGTIGKHAVAVTGYSLGHAAPVGYGPSGLLLRSSRIDKVYAHDDQIGPFARMGCEDTHFTTSWEEHDTLGNVIPVDAYPTVLLIPLYHKIRIPYSTVHDALIPFDIYVEQMRMQGLLPGMKRLEWDLYLSTVTDFKREIRAGGLPSEYKRKLLLQSMPRFLWRATAILDDRPALDLLFDATDIEQGRFFLRAVDYGLPLGAMLPAVAPAALAAPAFHREKDWRYLDQILRWFAAQTDPSLSPGP